MRLYHFTSFEHLDQITTEGIKPSSFDLRNAEPDGVVWLTTSERPEWVDDPRKLTCRLKLFIPNGDPKLVRYEHWLKKNDFSVIEDSVAAQRGIVQTAWIYFGTIPPSCIRDILKIEWTPMQP
jgi:hypothetical protein